MTQDKDATQAPLHSEPGGSRLSRYSWSLAILWTAMVLGSWSWNLVKVRQGTEDAARIQARESFQMDVLYRRWNAMCGGVYAQVGDWIQPNPHLEVAERDLQTPSGRRLTLVNPAYMTRLIHELGAEASGIQGHITSLNPIRPENSPDRWETQSLQAFAQGEVEKSGLAAIDETLYMRLMRPLVTEESCLRCHAVQGYKEGDIRGGISISVPMAALQAATREYETVLGLGHGGLWLLGLVGLFWGRWRLARGIRVHQQDEDALLAREAQLRVLFETMTEGVVRITPEGQIAQANPAAERILGLTRAQIESRHYVSPEWKILRPDGTPMPPEEMAGPRAMKEQRPVTDVSMGVERPDGSRSWISVSAVPITSKTGRLDGVGNSQRRQRADRTGSTRAVCAGGV